MKIYCILLFFINLAASVLSRKVVCYFTNWAYSRSGDGKYTPADLDYSKCTNVLYAFASLDSDSVSIKSTDPQADFSNGYYKDVVKRSKAAKAKPSLSLGGWSDSGGKKYSVMLNSDSKRSEFVKNVVKYLEKYGFEGLDLDIEYPGCPQGDCSKGNPNDKNGYAQLLKELFKEFNPKGWVISAAISADPGTIDKAYDIQAMNKYMNWISVMTYDYHSSSEKETGPVSPLRTTSGDKYPNSNTENTINYLIKKGADKNKLTVGIPFYGYSYKLKSASNHGYWAPSDGKGVAGPFTADPGSPAYYEVCDFINNKGYQEVENSALGAYAYNGNNWISFNSQSDVLNKVNYVKKENLGGVIIWDTSFDDFKGKYCKKGKNPLLTTIASNIN